MSRAHVEGPPLPSSPAPVFLVGVAGIGMSGLAQVLRSQGHDVGGSDRDLTGSGRAELLTALRRQGIRIWPQDGSGVAAMRPAALVASSAVEPGNPDLVAAPGLPQIPRARALAQALNRLRAPQIAVAGSCGKTTVTAWTAAALHALGHSVTMVCGGIVRDFEDSDPPGNALCPSSPDWIVYEADESDGSLVEFTPDYGLVLNVGTDHFERDRLLDLFGSFVGKCRLGMVLAASLHDELRPSVGQGQVLFAEPGSDYSRSVRAVYPGECVLSADSTAFSVPGVGRFQCGQLGRHSVVNAAAVIALLQLVSGQVAAAEWPAAVASFKGVRQRFELLGHTPGGLPVYNDYAHNPEKIGAALLTARQIGGGALSVVFQPHGFGPLGFMREELLAVLAERLRPEDEFVFLPVYYAGGTTSFTPTSAEVSSAFRAAGLPVSQAPDRLELARRLRTETRPGMTILVMGARDPSLRPWAQQLTQPGGGR